MLLPALAVAAVLGIGGVGASAALSGTSPSRPRPLPAATAAPTGATVPSDSPSMPVPTVPPPVPGTPPPPPDFAISVVRGVSWVQVVGPRGRVLYAGMLRHGHTLSYPQRPLTLTIGDAGAVTLVIHHRAHAPAGRRGEVLRLVIR